MSSGERLVLCRAERADRRRYGRGRRPSDMLASLRVVADVGLQRAARGLSEMAGVPIEAMAAQVRRLPLLAVPELLGGPDTVVAAVYLAIKGEVEGHMVLMLPLDDAYALAAMLLGQSEGSPKAEDQTGCLTALAQSALAEVGNLTGSFFLAALADTTGLKLSPSPPSVVVDMSGAILDVVLADLSVESEDLLIIDTIFVQSQERVNAFFLVLPQQRYLDTVLGSLPR